jgi:hypothetical protein
VKTAAPLLADGAALRRGQEVLERDVQEGATRFREELVTGTQLRVHPDAPSPALGHPGGERKLLVDEDGLPKADEDACGHGGEAVPRGEKTAGLVQRRSNEAPVDDARARLVALAEREAGLVALDSLGGRLRQVDAVRVLVAAPPARWIVMGRNPLYRSPPRSKCAL